ncbi:hypothetical protein [Perigonia lusca single nucleopolyhedrovirus]|uniref:Uncharacterized protein n=1 Tax=Perigonia lusca single nucleopolyhedrovirus TaxID=1675865 RepID=A0A0M3WNH5_9ABAC|nr:hypothetical protein [Perigonia lusca single nucleopolyhedrovirus]AKN80551.1 hypothetical protein [Perigonia lusca single nucleopolyhedrovirus]
MFRDHTGFMANDTVMFSLPRHRRLLYETLLFIPLNDCTAQSPSVKQHCDL